MPSYVDGNTRTFPVGAAIGANIRVKISSGVLAVAGATDQDIGVTENETFAAGETVAVRLLSAAGTHKAVAAGAIAANAKVHGAADGEVNDTQATGSFLRGIAVTAATADQDVIEIIPCVGDTAGS